jgi:hypothetical protein
MIQILIILLILITANLVNSQIDAVRILGQKPVSHAINLGSYLTVMGASWWLITNDGQGLHILVYAIMGFTNRQIFFDIPLNWRRGLKWDYVSPAEPPAALMDRIEQGIFGRNGRLPVYVYTAIFIFSLAELLWVYSR